MKNLLLFLLIFETLYAVDYRTGKLFLKTTTDEIVIDGIIESAWNYADSADSFIQHQPFYGKEPSQNTVAKVLTTPDALYCLIISYDKTGEIQANSGTLDMFNGDVVSIMLDTYSDKRTAYKFAVSAAGVKSDCRMLDDGRNRDYNWDGIWFADSKVYDWGFVTEMMIPYKSISYNKELDEWGLDFDRWIPHATEDIYWMKYEENEGLRISKFGKLIFEDIKPGSDGMHLEIYPVALANLKRADNGKYKFDEDAGIDIFYNPSPSLTYMLTANPDFAQIEADPYDFNISRYETYFNERRPFFTEGNEIFMASGKENNSGFYTPLQLFYSRRIGRKLSDGSEVPLVAGTKAYGRLGGDWEYGGFLALTGEKKYFDDEELLKEDRAFFGAARIKKQIYGNSTIGAMFVGKKTKDNTYGVIDIDGAVRGSSYQLSYQLARSFNNSEGDFAAATGLRMMNKNWIFLNKSKYVGNKFEIQEVGYVPWKGTAEITTIGGPRWYYETGYLSQLLFYVGPALYYEKVDNYTDHLGILGMNMQFRDNWGYEINLEFGRALDGGVKFDYNSINFSSWFNISPSWNANVWGGRSRTYNFDREYLASYTWFGNFFEWNASKNIILGTNNNIYIEGKPSGAVEDITIVARPFINVVPMNYLNLRLYVDNVYLKSSQRLERVIVGLLFSYNFLPKSWIYLAYNEFQERGPEYDETGRQFRTRLHTTERASVVKIKYLYYL